MGRGWEKGSEEQEAVVSLVASIGGELQNGPWEVWESISVQEPLRIQYGFSSSLNLGLLPSSLNCMSFNTCSSFSTNYRTLGSVQ